MKIIFSPEKKYLNQITNWLHSEMLEKKSYFYHNVINANFTDSNFVCYVNDKDDPDNKIDLKAFHCEILNDHAALKKEQENYKDIEVICKLDIRWCNRITCK